MLWLAYLYNYLIDNFAGSKTDLAGFTEETREMWTHLDPEADEEVPAFECAADIVHFAVESGWIRPDQLMDASASLMDREESIIVPREEEGCDDEDNEVRRSPRRR